MRTDHFEYEIHGKCSIATYGLGGERAAVELDTLGHTLRMITPTTEKWLEDRAPACCVAVTPTIVRFEVRDDQVDRAVQYLRRVADVTVTYCGHRDCYGGDRCPHRRRSAA